MHSGRKGGPRQESRHAIFADRLQACSYLLVTEPAVVHTHFWSQGEQAILPKQLKLDFDFGKVVEDREEAPADAPQSDLTQVSRSLS